MAIFNSKLLVYQRVTIRTWEWVKIEDLRAWGTTDFSLFLVLSI